MISGSVDSDDDAATALVFLVLPPAVRAGVAVQVVGAAVRLALPGDTVLEVVAAAHHQEVPVRAHVPPRAVRHAGNLLPRHRDGQMAHIPRYDRDTKVQIIEVRYFCAQLMI